MHRTRDDRQHGAVFERVRAAVAGRRIVPGVARTLRRPGGLGRRRTTPVGVPADHQSGGHGHLRPDAVDVLVPRRAERADRQARPFGERQALRPRCRSG